jgi:hypothetical protein
MKKHRFTRNESSKCPFCKYLNKYEGEDGFADCCGHLESVYEEVKNWYSYKPCDMHYHWKFNERLNEND